MNREKHERAPAASVRASGLLTHVTTTFEGHELTTYALRGRACTIAQEHGTALGYTEDGFRATLGNWSDELVDGRDIEVLTGETLAEFKGLLPLRVKLTLSRARSLTILYESGFDLVNIKTEKPLGKKLRRHLADEVLPKLRRGETIRGNDSASSLTRADVESIADAAVTRALAKVAEGDMPSVRQGDEQRLGRGIGDNSAEIYVLCPLREIARIKARAIGNDLDPDVVNSIRLVVEHELRRVVGHSPLLRWSELPIFLLDDAANALQRMRAEAENLERNSGFVRDANGAWVRSEARAKQGELYAKDDMGPRRGRTRRKVVDEAASRAGDDTLFNGPRKPGNAH